MQNTKWLKLTMAIVGVLMLIGVSSAQATVVELEGTTAVGINNLEVAGTYYNVSFTAGNWQEVYSDPPEFDVTPAQASLFSDKINQALNSTNLFGRGASSVGERGATLSTGFYMIGDAISTETTVHWWGGFYVEELPNKERFGAWISEIDGEIFEATSEAGMWAKISVIPGSGDQPLDVRKASDGTGTVTSAPAGIDCGSTCTRAGYMFDTGTSVTLTATPDAGSAFSGWSGCDQTDANTCTVEMTAAKAVTATFKKSRNAEIIVSWDNGIWYWDEAASQWIQMEDSVTDGDIAAGEFTGDDIADVASSWPRGLWYQDGDTLVWTKVTGSAATRLTAGDITGDGLSEIIGTWDSGLWYWNVGLSTWNLIYPFFGGAPLVGDIAAGDFIDDGRADVAFIFLSDIILVDTATNNPTSLQDRTGVVPKSMTAGDVTGDGRDEIIVSFDDGIWYWDVTSPQQWTQMTASVTDGDIAAGDFNGDGFADVASIWPSGLWYQDGATLAWTKIPVDTSDGPSGVPNRLTAGNITEN